MSDAAFVDTSVVLRVVLDEPGQSVDLRCFCDIYASRLLRVEALRVLSRLMLDGRISPSGFQQSRERLFFLLQGLNLVKITDQILDKAEEPLPIALGTLDAIHLVSALVIRDELNILKLTMLTYDKQLARAAQAMGLAALPVKE